MSILCLSQLDLFTHLLKMCCKILEVSNYAVSKKKAMKHCLKVYKKQTKIFIIFSFNAKACLKGVMFIASTILLYKKNYS